MRSATVTNKRCSWVTVDSPLLLQYHVANGVCPFIMTANISRSSCSQVLRLSAAAYQSLEKALEAASVSRASRSNLILPFSASSTPA